MGPGYLPLSTPSNMGSGYLTIHPPPVQTCSVEDLPPPITDIWWWPVNHVWLESRRYASDWNAALLPPANKVAKGNVFTSVCHSVYRGMSCSGSRGQGCASGSAEGCALPWTHPRRPPTHTHTHSPLRSTSGRYAFYGNAFLLMQITSCKSRNLELV